MAKYRVKQIKSIAGQTERVKRTLACLGLGRIGKEKVHSSENAAVSGMLRKVRHLVYITEEK